VPILLFHDSLGCVALWRSFPAALAAATGRRVVAYDRLGFGRSDPHPGHLTLGFVAAEAANVPLLCEALGIADFVACGHSVGGGMAVAASAALPNAITAVITAAAQAFVEDRTAAGIRAAREAFAAPGQIERLARHHGDKARWVLDAWTETWLSPRFADWTLDDDLRRLRCPVLAIHGDRDEYGSRLHPERIGRLSGGPCEVLILDDCGHVPHREKADDVLRAVSVFLRRRSAAPARP